MIKRNRDLIKLNKELIKLLASPPKTMAASEPHLFQSRRSSRSRASSKKTFFLLGLAVMIFGSSVIMGLTIAVISRFALLEAFLTMMSTSSLISDSNILIVGADNVAGSHRSDTIMVIHVSPNSRKVSVVSIPRDTIMDVPGIGLTKINHAFAYGGVNLTKRTVENFLGVTLPFCVTINMDGLARIIDTLGGLTINVEKRMYYVDYAGGLFVDLYPGLQHLNGRQSIGYVRFRNDSEGDIGRIIRQQRFVQALAKRIVTKKNVLSAPKVILSLLSNVSSNMGTRQVLGLAMSMRQAFDIGNIEMVSVPGEPIMIDKIFYLKPNIAEVERITQKYLKPDIAKQRTKGNWRADNN